MLAFPCMIEQAARDAGISVPTDVDADYNADLFPHWHLFCNAQLGVAMSPGAHWENAKVIAAIPEVETRTVTHADLQSRGWIF